MQTLLGFSLSGSIKFVFISLTVVVSSAFSGSAEPHVAPDLTYVDFNLEKTTMKKKNSLSRYRIYGIEIPGHYEG